MLHNYNIFLLKISNTFSFKIKRLKLINKNKIKKN